MLGGCQGDGSRTSPISLKGSIKFQITNLTMPNNLPSMKYSLKSVPGLADVGVFHGDGDGPRAPPRCPGGPENISND